MILEQEVIARFMDMKLGFEMGYTRWMHDWFDPKGNINGMRNDRLLFGSNWNWIMPVIEKINQEYIGGKFEISMHYVQYTHKELGIEERFVSINIIGNAGLLLVKVIKQLNEINNAKTN